jgi:hypothetical protein
LRQRETEIGKSKRPYEEEDSNFLTDSLGSISLTDLSEGEEEEA